MPAAPETALTAAIASIRSRIAHPEQAAFFDYWLARRRTRGLPARRDLDPLDFPSLLPRIALIDVLRASDDPEGGGAPRSGPAARHAAPQRPPAALAFRYRLAGTEIAARARRDPTGKRFEQLYAGDYLAQAQALYEEIARDGLPHLSERVYPVEPGRETLRYTRLILPLAADGKTVDMIALVIAVIDQKRLDDALEAFQ